MNKIDKLLKLNLFLFLSITLLFSQITNINGERGVWKNYLTVDGISSNYIYDVYVDDDNSVWLSTTSGVTHFNGITFNNYGTETGLPASNIKNVLRTSLGDIIVVSETNGAYKLNEGIFTQITGLYGKTIYTSAIDSDGNLVLTTEKGVFTHKGEKFNSNISLGSKIITTIEYFQKEVWYGGKGRVYYDSGGMMKEYDFSNYSGDSKVTSIVSTSPKEAWIGTLKGLFKIQGETITKVKNHGQLPSNVIKSLFLDKEQNLWVGTDKGLYNYSSNKFTQIKSSSDSENQIEDQKVYSIGLTDDKKYFIGTFGSGLFFYDPYTFRNLDENDGFKGTTVRAVTKLKNEKVWVGTDKGLVLLNGEKIIDRLNNNKGLPSNVILDLHYSDKGMLWIATTKGFAKYKNGRIQSFSSGLPSKIVTTIFSDNSEIVWLGSDGSGVTAFKNDDFYNYSMADGLASNNVYDILQSPEGLIYFACYGGGVSVWDGKSFTDLFDDLPDKRIFSLAFDHNQNLWIGMESGVAVYDGKSIVTFTKSDGLAHNETRVLKTDNRGRIWAGSFGGGVSCYDNGLWISLNEKDGLISNTIESIASLENGTLIFGGKQGISYYDPTEYDFPLIINNIQTPSGDLSINSTATAEIQSITNDRIFIDISSVNYNDRIENRYFRFRVPEISSDWSTPQNLSSFEFNPQSAGNYTYEVQSIDSDFNYSKLLSIPFKVVPVWYLNPKTAVPFWGILLILISLTVFTSVNYQKKNLESKRLREAEAARQHEELEMAREFQLSLLPEKLPDFKGFSITGYQKTSTEVGGDYYDFFENPDGSFYAICGDATGHGLTAGNIVSITKSVLVSAPLENPKDILLQLNKTLIKLKLGLNRMCVNMVKVKGNKVIFTSAGMPPAYHYIAKEGKIKEILIPGLPLGSLPNMIVNTTEITLNSGDVFVMMSDGFPEAPDPEGELLSYETVEKCLFDNIDKDVTTMQDELVRITDEWLAGGDLPDDCTMVILKKT
jgi:ligand-binding sensor domain-containing protein